MPRVTPVPVDILIDGAWIRGTVRTCDVTPDGHTCTAIVSYGDGPTSVTTRRIEAARMRKLNGEPGCPAEHHDDTCG